ncbi:MAG TPA: hypothetical protein VMS76_17295 [Planctomycetota bacterium]|nr:hypothetical protein [Planctomycetota bacterium]
MPNHYSATRSLPLVTAFSPKERQLAEKALRKREAQGHASNASRAQKAYQIADNVERQLRNHLGLRKFAALRDGLRQERLALQDAMQPPKGLKRDFAKQRVAGRRRVDSLLRKLGASRAKVNKILSAADVKYESAFLPDHRKVASGFNLSKNLSKWSKLSPLHKFPLPWGVFEQVEDPNDPHRWFLFRPPFFGFLFSEDSITTSSFTVDRLMFLHPPSGLVGNECRMDCSDAGNFDAAHIIGEAQIAFAFTPPTAGIIEVLIDAQSTFDTHNVSFKDEFGFSEAWCNQHSYLMMDVLHPNVPQPSLALMSSMAEETDGDDLVASQQNLARGQHFFAQLLSSGPVPGGQTVIITVGARTFDISRADDMELHSRSNCQWFISSVEARVAP